MREGVHMYLRRLFIENVGPIEHIDLKPKFAAGGRPIPLVIVGKNGTGKTIALAHIVDALAEAAKRPFRDIVDGQTEVASPYLKVTGNVNQRYGCESGIAVAHFSGDRGEFAYVDKSGHRENNEAGEALIKEVPGLPRWPIDDNFKGSTELDKDVITKWFREDVLAFFPSSRSERPHWVNPSVGDRLAPRDVLMRFADRLEKPLVVQQAGRSIWDWVTDVCVDTRAEVLGESGGVIRWSNIPEAVQNLECRRSIEQVFRIVLDDTGVQLRLRTRHQGRYRLEIGTSTGVIPSAEHLSAGQAVLLVLFLTILKYSELVKYGAANDPSQISGIVLVDELDAHLHTSLLSTAVPKLIAMFPRIQFVLAVHSPVLLLGLTNSMTTDGVTIVEMPHGRVIGPEAYGEFSAAMEVFEQTGRFNARLEALVGAGTQPLVLTEGELDPAYLRRAAELRRPALASRVEIKGVGQKTPEGTRDGGQNALKHARGFLHANPGVLKRRVLLLWDPECKDKASCIREAHLWTGTMTLPAGWEGKSKVGVEALLPASAITDTYYTSQTHSTPDGGSTVKTQLDKSRLCRDLCQSDDPALFAGFDSTLDLLEKFANGTD